MRGVTAIGLAGAYFIGWNLYLSARGGRAIGEYKSRIAAGEDGPAAKADYAEAMGRRQLASGAVGGSVLSVNAWDVSNLEVRRAVERARRDGAPRHVLRFVRPRCASQGSKAPRNSASLA